MEMVIGYPRQDAGRMYEAEMDRDMEKQGMKELDWQRAWHAERAMWPAVQQFDGICDMINEAANHLQGTAEEDKVKSCLTRMEDIFTEIKQLYKQYERRAW